MKFRAYLKEYDIVAPVTAINFAENDIEFDSDKIDEWNPSSDFDNVILMQSTGLLDRNCDEIYVGDILQIMHWSQVDPHSIVVCKQCKTGFCFTKMTRWDYGNNKEYKFTRRERFSIKELKNCKIVGNIYSNPELLERYNND